MALANKEESNDTKLNSDPIDFCMMKQNSLAMIKHILYILNLPTFILFKYHHLNFNNISKLNSNRNYTRAHCQFLTAQNLLKM